EPSHARMGRDERDWRASLTEDRAPTVAPTADHAERSVALAEGSLVCAKGATEAQDDRHAKPDELHTVICQVPPRRPTCVGRSDGACEAGASRHHVGLAARPGRPHSARVEGGRDADYRVRLACANKRCETGEILERTR